MNLVRRIFGLAMTAVLVAFAAPISAQQTQKIFSVVMSASPDNPGYWRALFTNESPNGSSTINSIKMTAPTGTNITDVKLQYKQSNTSISALPASTVSISNIPTIQGKGGNAWYDFKLDKLPTQCVGTWTPQAFAGNAFSQPFTGPLPDSVLTTAGSGTGCNAKVVLATVPATNPTQVTENTTGVSMTATFTNEAPANGPTFASVSLIAPTGLLITDASVASGTGTVAVVGQTVTVTNLSPAIAGQASYVISLTVSVPAACTSSTVNWTPSIYVGSGGTGNTFGLDSTNSSLSTKINAPTCAASFDPTQLPNGIISTTGKPVTYPNFNVNVTGGDGTGSVTVAGDTCTITGTLTQSLSAGSATFTGLQITDSTATLCKITADAGIYGTLSSTITVYDGGPLPCNGDLGTYQTGGIMPPNTTINDPGYAQGQRGGNNKDGSQCVVVGYEFSNNITSTTVSNPAPSGGTGNNVTFTWDRSVQPNAAFDYTVTWKKEYVDSGTGLPKFKTYFKWDTGPLAGQTLPGQSCVGPVLPVAYTTLTADIAAKAVPSGGYTVSDTINVTSGGTLPATPFPIVIDTERMLVTDTSGGTSWSVLRGPGVGGPTSPGAHSKTDTTYSPAQAKAVMSTPLPLYPSAADSNVKIVMPSCIVKEGWQSVTPGGAASVSNCTMPTDNSPPPACVVPTTRIFDIGDLIIGRG